MDIIFGKWDSKSKGIRLILSLKKRLKKEKLCYDANLNTRLTLK